MMRFRFNLAAFAFAIGMGATAQAAPLTFDCNAPTETASAIANAAQMPPAISGTITPNRARPGRQLPMVGAQLISPDGQSEVGFVLTLPAANSQFMDVSLIVRRGSQSDNRRVGQIDVNNPIPFRLYVDPAGVANIEIQGRSFNSGFVPIVSGTESVFCSTGQFTFTNLRFSD
ncbi:MAG: hypothetical protein WA908_07685 [Pontixanthobacter sp.]